MWTKKPRLGFFGQFLLVGRPGRESNSSVGKAPGRTSVINSSPRRDKLEALDCCRVDMGGRPGG